MLLLSNASTLFGQVDANALFEQANEFYQQKRYTQAAETYEKILDSNQKSADLYYNLGNAYYKNKQLGKSILNYERALRLMPQHEDALYNLSIAQAERIDEIENLPPFFLSAWWNNLSSIASSTIWGLLAIILLWLSAGGWATWFLGKTRELKKKGFLVGLTALAVAILPFAFAFSQSQQEKNSNAAIIISKEINLHSGPDATSTPLNQLHEGTKLLLEDTIGDWWQIRLGNGEKGWVNQSGVEKI